MVFDVYITALWIGILITLCALVGLCRLYNISGHKWWTAIIPFYNSYVLGLEAFGRRAAGVMLTLGWMLYVLFKIFPIIMIVPDTIWTLMGLYRILYVFIFLASIGLMIKQQGFESWIASLSVILPIPFLLMAVFGNVGRTLEHE